MSETKKEEVKSKGPLGKIKESLDDKEEQLMFLSTIILSLIHISEPTRPY